MLDARSGRDPTYSSYGQCKGSATNIITDAQWAWLEEELEKESEIKIIGSGIQVGWRSYITFFTIRSSIIGFTSD